MPRDKVNKKICKTSALKTTKHCGDKLKKIDLCSTSNYMPYCHTVKYLNNSCRLSLKTPEGQDSTELSEITKSTLRNPPGQPWWRTPKTPVWVPPPATQTYIFFT